MGTFDPITVEEIKDEQYMIKHKLINGDEDDISPGKLVGAFPEEEDLQSDSGENDMEYCSGMCGFHAIFDHLLCTHPHMHIHMHILM